MREEATARAELMSTPVEVRSISNMTALLLILSSRLRYTGPLKESDGGIVLLRIALPVEDVAICSIYETICRAARWSTDMAKSGPTAETSTAIPARQWT